MICGVCLIGPYVFGDDIRLEKSVISAFLRQWDQSVIRRCPGLREIENHSGLVCEAYQYDKCITGGG